MGIKQLYNDNLRKLPNEYGDVSVMQYFIGAVRCSKKTVLGIFSTLKICYRNYSKFSDRFAWANSADPDQTVFAICHSICIVWTHYSILEPHSSNFRVITTNFLGVQIFRKFTVIYSSRYNET